jgi:tight adherence protein B
MPGWAIGAIFLLLFALIMVVVSFGLKWTEKQRSRQVGRLLHRTMGTDLSEPLESEILAEESQRGGLEFLNEFRLYRAIRRDLTLGALNWSPFAVIAAMAGLGFLGAVAGTRVVTPVMRELTMAGLAFAGGILPYAIVSYYAKKRMSAFEELFPEALDFLARSMRAGHAFSVSLEMMAEETPDPVGSEFRWIFHEQNLGGTLEETLRNFAQRIPLVDTKMFVSAVLLQRETGGNLAEILTKLAYIIRERFRLKGQVRAASAHGRLTAVILSLMPLVTLILLNIIAPQYFKFMIDDEHGRWIVLAVVILQLIGYYWMRKIINIKV